jgi:hypothetical protein
MYYKAMSILDSKLLFVHINKSGGGYITESFKKNGGNTACTGYHRTLDGMLTAARNAGISTMSMVIFTVVRNPWARMVSMYEFYRSNVSWRREFGICDCETGVDRPFIDWIKHIYSSDFPRETTHSKVNVYRHCFCDQLNWLDSDQAPRVRILKLEDIKGIDRFLKEHGVRPIGKVIHSTNHVSYRTYYNDEARQAVADHYSRDIKEFGYAF